jgi:predicted GH43/DUF377 family glycosyl hydrolase
MKKKFIQLVVLFSLCFFSIHADDVVLETKRIHLEEYPDAFNPSMIKMDDGYLMTFRYCPDRTGDSFSFIGIVKLDESFDLLSTPQLLDTRYGDTTIPSHSEDARIFILNGKTYITYNDNPDLVQPTNKNRRDIFIAELVENEGEFKLISPLKLVYPARYEEQLWQKNWVPFVWEEKLMMGYSVTPHEALHVNVETGYCLPLGYSKIMNIWNHGALRGGTPAILEGDKYLAFFHSSKQTTTTASNGKKMLHYYMGAYTFSAFPPFNIESITPEPIISKDFYTKSDAAKRVIFPGGFVVTPELIYVAYGKDDKEVWIAIIDRKALESSMISIESSTAEGCFPLSY